MQAGQRHVRAGVGVVDGIDLAALDQGLAGVELPPEEAVDQPPDRHHLGPGLRREEVVVDRVAQVHGLVRLEAHDHRLGADRQRAGEDVVVDGLLQVHEHLAALVVGGVQFGRVADPGDAAPGTAVIRLHEQRVADPLRDGVQVEGLVVAGGGVGVARVVHRVLVGDEHGLRHLEAQPHHRAVGRVLLHGLEGERAVQQVHAVHQGDLLQPLPRVVVPVREPVDDQVVAGAVAQVERLDGDPLAVEGVPGAAGARRPGPAGAGSPRTPSASPPRYRAATRSGAWKRSTLASVRAAFSRIVAGDGRAGRARRASRGARRGPTGRARA